MCYNVNPILYNKNVICKYLHISIMFYNMVLYYIIKNRSCKGYYKTYI